MLKKSDILSHIEFKQIITLLPCGQLIFLRHIDCYKFTWIFEMNNGLKIMLSTFLFAIKLTVHIMIHNL